MLGAIALTGLLAAQPAGMLSQDWLPGTYMAQALAKTASVALDIAEEDGLGFAEGICFLGAFMNKGSSLTYKKRLSRDEDAEDVDLTVVGPDGDVLSSDDDEDSVAYADFVAEKEGVYTLKVTLASGTNSFIPVAMMTDGGWDPSESLLVEAASDLLNTAATVNDLEGMKFHEGWCLIGGVLEENNELKVDGLNLKGDPVVVVGACDTESDDVDLRA